MKWTPPIPTCSFPSSSPPSPTGGWRADRRRIDRHATGASGELRPEGLAPLSRLHALWLEGLALLGAGPGGIQAVLPDRRREGDHLLRHRQRLFHRRLGRG